MRNCLRADTKLKIKEKFLEEIFWEFLLQEWKIPLIDGYKVLFFIRTTKEEGKKNYDSNKIRLFLIDERKQTTIKGYKNILYILFSILSKENIDLAYAFAYRIMPRIEI